MVTNDLVNLFGNIFKGSWQEAGNNLLNLTSLGLWSGIQALKNAKAQKVYSEIIAESNRRQEYHNRLLKIANSELSAIQKLGAARNENLAEQGRRLQDQLNAELEKGKKTDQEKVLDMQDELAQNAVEQARVWMGVLEESVGSVADEIYGSLTDALMSAWENGESAALAYEQTVDEVMRSVIANLWKVNVLPKLMEPLISGFYEAMGLNPDGTYTGPDGTQPDLAMTMEEAANLKRIADTIGPGILASWESIEPLLNSFTGGLAEGNLTGISKAVGQMTEDTALTLAAVANSGLYYIIGMYNFMARWDSSIMGDLPEGSVPIMTEFQSQALSTILAIKADTLRIAAATEQTAADLRSVISASGTRAIMGISIN